MGLLEQILFVADYTEPGREGAVFDLVRETLRKGSLLRAVLAECESTIQYVINGKDRQLCTQTVRTRNWALKKIAEEAEHVGKTESRQLTEEIVKILDGRKQRASR